MNAVITETWLWKAMRSVYCSLPFMKCSNAVEPVKTCFELWIDTTIGNILAIQSFITFNVFASFAFLRNTFVGAYCSLPYVTCAAEPPPEENISWKATLKYAAEVSFSLLLSMWESFRFALEASVIKLSFLLYQSYFVNVSILFLILSLVTLKIFKIVRCRTLHNSINHVLHQDVNWKSDKLDLQVEPNLKID
ncbi:hypothetical protein CDAR_522001 [Caerostris darwini]|uniref:Uncharacterized protein n=1 Tax=Caerostris darwini TaxID=1538125 RepID=A0AAV4SSC7_9ARAC|nr:hypothetical protein CDAR_522001 [Caerostris darwini]